MVKIILHNGNMISVRQNTNIIFLPTSIQIPGINQTLPAIEFMTSTDKEPNVSDVYRCLTTDIKRIEF